MSKMNQRGSLMVFLTLGFALIGTFVGFALDFSRAYLEKARISRLIDSAALAAAKVLKGQVGLEAAATRAACDSMLMNGAKVVYDGGNGCTVISGSPIHITLSYFDKIVGGGAPIRFVRVEGSEPVNTTFLRFLGWMIPGSYSVINVNASAEAGPERPIDLMLVLDRSGSMNINDGSGNPKIVALKTSVNTFLNNNFTVDDHIGMTSFAYRGCGGGPTTGDSTIDGNCTADKPLGSSIASILSAVNALAPNNGSTNTMEALKVANAQITNAINDPVRAATRKVVLLITDGRPTSSRRTGGACNTDPISGATLGISNPPANCVHSVFTSAYDKMYWNHLFGSTPQGSGFPVNPPTARWVSGATFYKNFVRHARETAVVEANTIRNLAGKTVLIYVIAVGKIESAVGNSLDDNAKCWLGRIANDPNSINGSCPNVFTTSADGDTYPDMLPCKVNPTACIDETQQKGRVFTVDLSGNVQQQLDAVFDEVALLLKLRLTL